jgi:hypothetical protein
MLTSGLSQLTVFSSTYQHEFEITQGINDIKFATDFVQILSPTDFVYFFADTTQLVSLYTSNRSDYVWHSNSLARIDSVQNYKFNIQMILAYYIYSDIFTLSYVFDVSGMYNVVFKAGNVGVNSSLVNIQLSKI